MIFQIQVLPTPPGTEDNRYLHVEAAIAAVENSGLRYEVGALGTNFEGEPDEAWALARSAHEAVLASGARSVVTILKLAQRADGTLTMDGLVAPFRADDGSTAPPTP